MELLEIWSRQLFEQTGINLTIFYDAFDRRRFFAQGLVNTLLLSIICCSLSVVIGILGAWLQGSRFALTKRIVRIYIEAFRNTPPLIQLFFFYFVIGTSLGNVQILPGIYLPSINNFGWAIISFSFYYGAFNIEIFRSGIDAVPRSNVEAAEALGYSRFQTYRYVVLPLAFRVSLPALNNSLVALIKATSLAYAIAVPEMLYVAAQIWSDELNVIEMMNVILVFYVAYVGIFVYFANRLEHRLRIPGYHH